MSRATMKSRSQLQAQPLRIRLLCCDVLLAAPTLSEERQDSSHLRQEVWKALMPSQLWNQKNRTQSKHAMTSNQDSTVSSTLELKEAS